MESDLRRVRHLQQWVDGTLPLRTSLIISGGFRGEGSVTASVLDLLELDGSRGDTVRLLIPDRPPINANDPSGAEFTNGGRDKWWTAWAAVLAAAAIVPPIVDPRRLDDILQEERRLRFCCDTNGLASGVASWLLLILEERADIVTSAVVDRELAAWPDRRRGMWAANTVDRWLLRTHYRLARRLTEAPPRGVVIDRLSPEQGALMLAKLRDERGWKSPDADMLLVELARGLIRDQPRNARVLYLTGDRNNARAATNALGPENVLFAVPDAGRARACCEKVVVRGWWRPADSLGTVLVPTVGRLFWDLLAACEYLVVSTQARRWLVSPCYSINRGVPSDWADPWVEIRELSGSTRIDTGATAPTAAPVSESSAVESPEPRLGTTDSAEWLLPPYAPGEPLDVPPSWRPAPQVFFALLWQAMRGAEPVSQPNASKEVCAEGSKLLLALGAVDAVGGPGPRIEEFRAAWEANDRDWFHAELQRLSGYRQALERLRGGSSVRSDRRADTQVSMARALGQVARLDHADAVPVVGDAPVSVAGLSHALTIWLPTAGDTIGTEDLCRLAARDLRLTPARLEIALARLWTRLPDLPFEGQTGGTVTPGHAERVVSLSRSGYEFTEIAPGALSFGRSGTVRFIVRSR